MWNRKLFTNLHNNSCNLFIFLVCSTTKLYNFVKQVDYNEDLEHLIIDIVTEMLGELNCLAIINDNNQQDIFGGRFFKSLGSIPYYKVFNY
jgi:hypothetical protein